MPRDFSIFRARKPAATRHPLCCDAALTTWRGRQGKTWPRGPRVHSSQFVSLGYHGGYNGGKTIIWDSFLRLL